MKTYAEYTFRILLLAVWIAGIVLAKGFWSTFFAIFFAPYSWYLVMERVLTMNGIIT
jgi:uncharacterized membrane protein